MTNHISLVCLFNTNTVVSSHLCTTFLMKYTFSTFFELNGIYWGKSSHYPRSEIKYAVSIVLMIQGKKDNGSVHIKNVVNSSSEHDQTFLSP